MSAGDYSVAVKLSLVNNVSSGLIAMAGHFAMLTQQANVLQDKLNSLRFQSNLGSGMVAFGSAMVAPLIGAVNQAGKLEQQLFVVQSATQANVLQMNEYRKAIERVATTSIFSSIKVAEMGKIIATTGNFKIEDMAQVTELFTRFATIQNLVKGTSYEASTKQGLQLAEISGHFDPSSIEKSLSLLTKLNMIMPDNIQQVLGSMKYMQGTVKNVMGVEDEQGMLFVAMLNRMGVSGTRAGSMLTAAISRSIPGVMGSGLWEGKSPQALAAMGMVDAAGHANYFNKEGKFDAVKWMSLMGQYVQREFAANAPAVARENIMKNFQYAYGMNGARIAGLMSSPEALQQYQMLQKIVKEFPDMDKLYERMDSLYNKQLPQAMENFNTILTNLGYTLLPVATKALGIFNDNAKSFIQFLQDHEDAVRSFAEAFLWIGGLSILGGILLLVKTGLTGLILPLEIIVKLWPLLVTNIATISVYGALAAGALGAVGIALYLLYQNWDEVKDYVKDTRAFEIAKEAFYYLGMYIYRVSHPVETLQLALDTLFNTIVSWLNRLRTYANLLNPFSHNQNLVSSGKVDGSPYVKPGLTVIPRQAPYAISDESAKVQPIHVQLNVDGHKMASVVANHIANQASNMPSTTSLYDTALSPMPPIVNAIGIS